MPETRSRAFLFGESTLTTVRVENGIPQWQEAHAARLESGAEWLWPGRGHEGRHKVLSALARPRGGSGVLRLTLHGEGTRGEWRMGQDAPLSLDEWYTPGLPSTAPLDAMTVEAPPRPSWWPSHFKTSDHFARILAAREVAAGTVPLFTQGTQLAEFAWANLVLWEDGGFTTPPAGPQVLAGLGRARLGELARAHGVAWRERDVDLPRARAAGAVWAVNAVRGLVRVRTIDGHPCGEHPIPEPLAREFFRA